MNDGTHKEIPDYEQSQSSSVVWRVQLHRVHNTLDPLMQLKLTEMMEHTKSNYGTKQHSQGSQVSFKNVTALILAVTGADGVVQTTVAKKLGIKTVANYKK